MNLREALTETVNTARLKGLYIKSIELRDDTFAELLDDAVVNTALNCVALKNGFDTRAYGHIQWDGVNIINEEFAQPIQMPRGNEQRIAELQVVIDALGRIQNSLMSKA